MHNFAKVIVDYIIAYTMFIQLFIQYVSEGHKYHGLGSLVGRTGCVIKK